MSEAPGINDLPPWFAEQLRAQSLTKDQSAIYEMPNQWARISEIAAKAGVAPMQAGHAPTICATGADGKQYDVWEVLSGVLDKIDRANT